MMDKEKFVQLVTVGALTFDRKYQKLLAIDLVNVAMKMPQELFIEEGYSEYTYACDLMDFEYGVFDACDEKYPEWINKYFEWKTKNR